MSASAGSPKLPASVRAEAQRILDAEARRVLAERLERADQRKPRPREREHVLQARPRAGRA